MAKASNLVRSSRWLRRAAWGLGGLLLLWGLAYLAVPLVVKSQVEKIASEKLGRQVTVGAVSFKPWSLELTVNDLAIAKSQPAPPAKHGDSAGGAPSSAVASNEPSQASPQLHIKRLYIDAELESLLRLAPVADAIVVEDPVVSLTHLGGGRYDIDDILERLKTPASAPASEPPRFSLYNLRLSGGQMDFIDQPAGRTHTLRELTISVPFLSNLKSQRDIKTSPHLAFKLNGSSFDTAAVGTPFAQTHKTDAQITLRGLDLKPYLAYLPASLPFRLQSAVLHADAKVAFEQTPNTVVKISGTVTAEQVHVLAAQTTGQAPAAHDLLSFDRLQVGMEDVRPLEQFVKLSSVELSAPTLDITRDRSGRLNLLLAPVQSARSAAINNEADGAHGTRATGQNDSKNQGQAAHNSASSPATAAPLAKATPATPWKVQLGKVSVHGGAVNWLDETLSSPAQIRLADIVLEASAIAIPFAANAPLQFKGSLGLDQSAAAALAPPKSVAQPAAKAVEKSSAPPAAAAPARVSFSGTATDLAAQVTATVADWPLGMAATYVSQFLQPALNGQLDAQLGVNWQAATADKPQALQVTASQLALSDVQLAQGKTALASVKRVELDGVDVDVPGQRFKAAKIQLSQPKAKVEREADQRWMYERWLVGHSPASAPPVAHKTGAVKAKADTPSWAVAIDELSLAGGAISFSDKAGAKPVNFEVTGATAQLGGLVLDDKPSAKAASAKAQSMLLTASLRLASGHFAPGKLDFKGSLGLAPLQAQGRLVVDRLPVQAFEPYFAGALNIELLRADTSFKGQVAYRQTPAGPKADLAGDVALEEFRANTLAPSEDLLTWKTLNVRGLTVALEPAKATRVDVKETVLTDFFARVIVTPEGRINLQDLLKPADTAKVVTPASSVATEKVAAEARPASAGGQKGLQTLAVAPPAPPAAAPAGPPPIVNFGPMSLINGKVLFSDRFVKPNYSADLSELTGKLSAFSSVAPVGSDGTAGAPNMADLELRGKAEGTASLEILGKLNPLAKPLALDIKGQVRDLELPPLSPYAIKYAGYGINRGKLSVDVSYLVLPDGQLTASNKLVLNQLSFGDKVEGSTASLPVKLAVALLADRNGVIDLDLPIKGSLNDPQFSLGPIIVKVIVNVIVKAITSPFSLLAHALGGGGEELNMVAFPAGSAQLSAEARSGLDKVAKALADRPALQLTVVGTSSLEAERDGFKQERLNQLVRAEKRRQMAKDGTAEAKQEGGSAPAALGVSPAEYPALLKEVYKRADMPKPRNLIGLTKDQPVAEMERLLLADIKVSDDAMRELAVQRGMAVKDYLASRDLPAQRLFLGAAKTVPPEAKWTPRAELNLAMP